MGTGKVVEEKLSFLYNIWMSFSGDVGLVEVVGRENWTGKFCHVVSKHDIVPHMLFVPFESVVEPLIIIFLISRP